MDEGRRRRAQRRARWQGQLTTLDAQLDAAIVSHGTPAERIAMVWRVTRDAWAAAGRPIPRYRRSEIPGRILRNRDGPKDLEEIRLLSAADDRGGDQSS